jgi:hypothetical protein
VTQKSFFVMEEEPTVIVFLQHLLEMSWQEQEEEIGV